MSITTENQQRSRLQQTDVPDYILKPDDFNSSIRNNRSFYIQFNFFTPEVEIIYSKIIHQFLEKHDFLYLKEMLLSVTRELITNAIKANVKRLYFKVNNLDIAKKDDYRRGMDSFKNDVYGSTSDIFTKLRDVNLLVRIIFEYFPEYLQIRIVNNSPIIPEEYNKIKSRINKAFSYADISEAFDNVMDDSEGAGLGLIMALMLLKNAGFPKESFEIVAQRGLTSILLKVPIHLDKEQRDKKIAKEIMRELDKIPSFPENILEIQKLCADPNSTVRQISESIKKDPGLTTSLLKLANSAGYITLKHTKTIEDAVKLIGLKVINALLVASGVQSILQSRYRKFDDIWKESNRAAFYANRLSMQLNKTKFSEFTYLAALLSEIGKIILLSVKPELTKKIREIAGIKSIENTGLLEEMNLGISHSTLGSLICEKWNFNEILINTIKYHHTPYLSPKKYKDFIYIVYFAYCMIELENKKGRFELIDDDVLYYFNIKNVEEFQKIHRTLKSSFDTHYREI